MSRKQDEEAERLERIVAEMETLRKKEKAEELTDEERARLAALSRQGKNEMTAQLVVVVFAMIAGIILFFWIFSGEEKTEAESEREFQQQIERSILISATQMCHEYVRDRLRSPSTADFPRSEQNVTAIGRRAYEISGTVDAQNGFGATVRNRFVCQIQHLGDGDWRLVERNWNLLSLQVE